MARKKCKECLSCFNVVWIEPHRYYHCWLCNTWYAGQDSNLIQIPSPYNNKEVPEEKLKEQEENDT